MAQAEIERQIQALDRATLTGLVRQALGSETFELGAWHVQPAGASRGSATRGIYRVAGSGMDHGREADWSLMLKVVALDASRINPASDDLAHPLYWKREVLAYQSGLLEHLPGDVEAPRCFGVVEQAGDVCWLWLEEVKDAFGPRWPLQQYGRAARALGRFNGAYLAERPAPAYPWLGRPSTTRGLLNHFAFICDVIADPRNWEHTALRDAFEIPAASGHSPSAPNPVAARLLRLWDEREQFVAFLDRTPRTLCHKDAFRRNMFALHEPDGRRRLVMIDWAYVGYGELGMDAGDLLGASYSLLGVESSDVHALDSVIFENYLAGLDEAGWRGDPRLVRYAYAAFAALKYGALLPWLRDVADERKHAAWEELGGVSMEEWIYHQARLVHYLLDLADEARTLSLIMADELPVP